MPQAGEQQVRSRLSLALRARAGALRVETVELVGEFDPMFGLRLCESEVGEHCCLLRSAGRGECFARLDEAFEPSNDVGEAVLEVAEGLGADLEEFDLEFHHSVGLG